MPIDPKPQSTSTAEEAILEAIRSLQFGTVEVTIDYSRVVPEECTPKIRFGSDGTLSGKIG